MGATVVGNPAAAVMTSSPGLIWRGPSFELVRAAQARRLAEEPELMGLGPLAAFERLVWRGLLEHETGEQLKANYLWVRRLERRTRRLLGSDRTAIPGGG